MEDKDFYWLVGLLEGEGCFMKGSPSSPNKPKIQLQMTDKDVVEKVSKFFERKLYSVKPKNDKWKESFVVVLTGKRAVDLMRKLHPYMSKRRKEQIQIALDSYDENYKHKNHHSRNKLTDDLVRLSLQDLKSKSLRSIAKSLNVHPQSLKRRVEQVQEKI